MAQCSALRCISNFWQNNEKPLISNWLRFIVACLLSAALWVLFHTARHSYATSVCLANGVSIENVAKMLGHSNIKMTQHYARVLDSSILKDMNNVRDVLSGNLSR